MAVNGSVPQQSARFLLGIVQVRAIGFELFNELRSV
jgi:hypothetical protein